MPTVVLLHWSNGRIINYKHYSNDLTTVGPMERLNGVMFVINTSTIGPMFLINSTKVDMMTNFPNHFVRPLI